MKGRGRRGNLGFPAKEGVVGETLVSLLKHLNKKQYKNYIII